MQMGSNDAQGFCQNVAVMIYIILANLFLWSNCGWWCLSDQVDFFFSGKNNTKMFFCFIVIHLEVISVSYTKGGVTGAWRCKWKKGKKKKKDLDHFRQSLNGWIKNAPYFGDIYLHIQGATWALNISPAYSVVMKYCVYCRTRSLMLDLLLSSSPTHKPTSFMFTPYALLLLGLGVGHWRTSAEDYLRRPWWPSPKYCPSYVLSSRQLPVIRRLWSTQRELSAFVDE